MTECEGCHQAEGTIAICCATTGEPIVHVCHECLAKHFDVVAAEGPHRPEWIPEEQP